jgi:digeranylgeranylglycerophospholipid reductase
MMYDVLIVGAGPAGLSAAYSAAKSGAKVGVIEKSKEIGYPIHTSGGSWIDELKKLDVPERFMHPIRVGYFVAPGQTVVFEYENPPSCILDVRGLYQYLAELASCQGAEIFVNSTVVQPLCEAGKISGLKVRTSGKERIYHAPLIIDASGVAAIVARNIGLTNGLQRMGLGAEYDLHAPHWPQDRVAFLFGSQIAPSGYAWIFPHGNNRVRLGVGIIHPDSQEDPKDYLENFLNHSDLFREELSQISRIEYHYGVIPSELYIQRTVSDGVIVVGDAGGLISTLLGEGIRFAIEIGRMAGQVAGEAVKRKRYDEKFLSKFEKNWKKKYKRTFEIGSYLNKRLAQYSDDQWNRRVESLAHLDPKFVPILLKGEFTPKNLLRIIKAHPKFFGSTVYSAINSIMKAKFLK